MKQLQVNIEVSTGRIFTANLHIEEKVDWTENLRAMLGEDNKHLELTFGAQVVFIKQEHIVSIEIDEVDIDE